MVTFLNVSRVAGNNDLLKAEFCRVRQKVKKTKDILEEPFKQIEATPIELVTKILQELQSTTDPVLRITSIQPDVPGGVQVFLNKSLMSYYRATLPERSTVVKIEKHEKRKDYVVAVIYDSEDENYRGDFPPDVALRKGKPLEVASKVLDFLNNGFWRSARLEFDGEISQDVKDLFLEVIKLYNQSVSSK